MFESEAMRLTGARGRLLVVLVVCVACGVVGVSSALAKEPSGDFVSFKQCPRFVPGVNLCFYSQITGGSTTIGKQTVPIDADGQHPIVLQGGVQQQEEAPFAETFVGAANGETLSRTPQSVPGGLGGLVNCAEVPGSGFLGGLGRTICREVFASKLTGLSVTTELAGPASGIAIDKRNLLAEEGAVLSLPVKIHLESPILGRSCYIGSDQAPVVLNLTTGTTSPAPPNNPISGHVGEIHVNVKDGFNFAEIPGNVFVDNDFAVPQATGCGGILSFLIDPIINHKLGLPSPAGNNTIIQDSNLYEATSEAVIASEQ
jgi:hypothetical protein